MSSYLGWKYTWPQFSSMYRKRKRTSLVDVEKIKVELRVEVTEDVMKMLAAQGLQIQPFSRNSSPTPGRRSICASASKPVNLDVENKEDDVDDMDLMRGIGPDSIDILTEPTLCRLLIYPGGYQIEVARGLVYPQQRELHSPNSR
jgi:hypothetical protein